MKIILMPLFLICAVVQAETGYRIVHPDGTVEFSDQPTPEAEEIKLRPVPTIKLVPVTPSSSKVGSENGGKSDDGFDGTIVITSPQEGQTLWFGESGLKVEVAIDLALKSGQLIQISLDGKPVSRGTGRSFNLGVVYRGSHSLQASVVSATGSTLYSSPPLNFYVRQHSLFKRTPLPLD